MIHNNYVLTFDISNTKNNSVCSSTYTLWFRPIILYYYTEMKIFDLKNKILNTFILTKIVAT